MDAEWAAMAAPGVPVHTTRIKLPKVTVEDRVSTGWLAARWATSRCEPGRPVQPRRSSSSA
jgi:hypothetical protein